MAKKVDQKPLTAKEMVFVELVSDYTDDRTIPEKTVAAGYNTPKYGYKLLRRPDIAGAIEEQVNQTIKVLRARRGSVINALRKRATSNAPNANEAAKLYLQCTGDIGSGGISNVVNVKQENNAGTLEDGMDAVEQRRQAVIDAMAEAKE